MEEKRSSSNAKFLRKATVDDMDFTDDVPDKASSPQVPPRPSPADYSGTAPSYYPMRQPYYAAPFFNASTLANPGVAYAANTQAVNQSAVNSVQYNPTTYPYFPPLFRDNATIRQVEINSRGYLKSVETFISTLTSIAQMLDTTLNAFYTSFYSMISVADHFIGLKHNLQRIFTTIAALKFVRWFWRKILAVARLGRPLNPVEQAWSSVEKLDQCSGDFTAGTKFDFSDFSSTLRSSWPNLVFFAVAIGGPVLMYKLVKKLVANMEDSRRWASGDGEHYSAVALYNFAAASQREISLAVSQKLRIAPKELQPAVKGWLLASADGNEIGLVPANHVRVLGLVSGQSQQQKNLPFL